MDGEGNATPRQTMTPPVLHRFIVFTVCCTFLLLIAGALVTSNDAGLAVPDWPLSYGSFLPPMVGGILYEHGHRMVAGFVGVLTIILAVWAWREEPRRWVRWLAVGALGLVAAQAVLGGITVRFYLPPWISAAHATLAQLFFSATVTLALVTGRWWQAEVLEWAAFREPRENSTRAAKVRTLGIAAASAALLQLILGAAFRHKGIGIWPHLVGAAVVTGMIVWLAVALLRNYAHVQRLYRWAKLLLLLLGAQLLLGGAAYAAVWSARSAPQPVLLVVIITVTHVVVGALILAVTVALTLCCFRIAQVDGSLVPGSRLRGRESRLQDDGAATLAPGVHEQTRPA